MDTGLSLKLLCVAFSLFSILQTLYLGCYYLLMARMLLPVKKWRQLCLVQRVLRTKDFSNALRQ